ncbi:hypothetical protein [Lysinibacillus fusiformis]|uniref:hypothetical protein n=2 Tax=Lysinibacillus fusiformis TaxID=28031 RepID=UPI003717C928
MNMNANVDELRILVKNTSKRNILIRSLVFCKVTMALGPAFLRHPIDTIKEYIKDLASTNNSKNHA